MENLKDWQEKEALDTEANWRKILPEIQKNHLSLSIMLSSWAKGDSHGNKTQLRIERQAARDLLRMPPEEVGNISRGYRDYCNEHRSSLSDDPSTYFRLEALMHWIPMIISRFNR